MRLGKSSAVFAAVIASIGPGHTEPAPQDGTQQVREIQCSAAKPGGGMQQITLRDGEVVRGECANGILAEPASFSVASAGGGRMTISCRVGQQIDFWADGILWSCVADTDIEGLAMDPYTGETGPGSCASGVRMSFSDDGTLANCRNRD